MSVCFAEHDDKQVVSFIADYAKYNDYVEQEERSRAVAQDGVTLRKLPHVDIIRMLHSPPIGPPLLLLV